MEDHNLLEDHKYSGSGPISVDVCVSNSTEEIPKQDSNVDFDPCAPYSSSMDNVPLKLLFGVSNVKMRHSPTQEKAVQMDLCSPKDQLDSSESVRVKLRESLTSALALVCDEQQKKDSITEKNLKSELVAPERPFNLDHQHVEMEKTESTAEIHLHSDNESPKILKRDREEFEQKHQLAEAAISSCYLAEAAHEEQDERTSINADSSVMSTDMPEDGTLKRIKLDKEEINIEKSEQTTQISDIVQLLGVKIEAELFRKYAGVNKKYKEKARSLLFNLKDRNNPELRARVVSGEITPENLCCMTAEQLASKELSQWRIAKAEELAYMIVLPDSDVNFRRMVKKTHKGEFQVEVENDNVVAEAAASELPLQSKLEQPETEVPNIDEIANTTGNHDDGRVASPTSLPSRTSSGQVAGMAGSKVRSTEGATIRKTREEKLLPKIMSLDDYVGSRSDQLHEGTEVRSWTEESTEWATEANAIRNEEFHERQMSPPGQPNVEEDKAGFTNDHFVHGDQMHSGNGELDYPNGDQEWPIGKAVQSPSSEKLWEGMLQLNPMIVETVVAVFKSGEKTSAKDWSKFVEVKGRVRLDAFEKFLQELPLSRSRGVMVVSICCKTASLDNSLENILEIANSYKQDERVGYAEPAPGVELYLCPSNVTTLQLLEKFISYEHFENINEQDGLIGFVVWRRNNVTSNVMHTMPEKQYINAKQLALSGHMLDSPTHPGVSESVPYGTDSPKNDISTSYDKYPVNNKVPFMVSASKTITHVENTTSHAKDSSEMDTPPGFNSCPPRVASIDPRINVPKFQVSILHDDDDDLIDDVPPGFGPNAASVSNNAYSQTNTTNVDDDDLPEFDYNGVSASYQPPSSQLPPQRCLQPMPNSQCPSQPPQVSTNVDQGFFQSKDNFHPLPGHPSSHQIPPQVPRPPATPHPSIQIRELIQKYGQCDIPFSMGHGCAPDVGGVNFAPQIGQQPVMIPHHTPANAHTQIEKTWNGNDVPEWRPYFTPGTSLMQQMQPMIPSQLGAPNGNFQVGQCLPPRVTAPQRGPPQMLIPIGAPMQMLQPPPNLTQMHPHPSLGGMRPITGINLPVPMQMSEREHGQYYANNSQSFHTSHNFRPALSGPDTRPLDGRNRRV